MVSGMGMLLCNGPMSSSPVGASVEKPTMNESGWKPAQQTWDET